MSRAGLSALLCLGWLAPGLAAADGGTLLARRDVGAFTLSVVAGPTPPRIGGVEVGVLVQNARSGETLGEVPVELALWPVSDPARVSITAARESAGANRLLRGAFLEVDAPGTWILEVRAGAERLRLHMTVASAPPLRAGVAPFLIPPLGVALLALHDVLRRRRRR